MRARSVTEVVANPSSFNRTGTTFADVLALAWRPADERRPYGSDPNQFGDLRIPADAAGPLPIVVFIHGGCWESEYDLSHANAIVSAVTALGVATWSIEYRRVGQQDGGWPNTLLDAGRGVDFVRDIAAAHAVDLSRVIVMGHSAGGHLALWTVARRRVPRGSDAFMDDPIAVRGVISLAGITDLESAHARQVCESSPARLLGGPPSQAVERYHHASPSALLPIGVPQILIHGSIDTIVPVEFSTSYADAANARGDTARAVVVPGAGHFDVISPASVAWPVIVDAIHELLRA
jgi:acetyl esterase/lipase